MALNENLRYKLHIIVFLFISFQLFLFTPVEFFHRTIAAAICICVLLHMKNFRFYFQTRCEKALFALVSLYLAFSFFGFALFVTDGFSPGRLRDAIFRDPVGTALLWINIDYDINLPLTRGGISLYRLLFFALGLLWTSYVLQTALNAVKFLSKKARELNSAQNTESLNALSGKVYWKKWLLLFSILFVLFMVWQRAFNPVAMVFPDSWEYLYGWMHGTYVSFRSPLYAFFVNIICTLAPTQPEVQWVVFTHIIAFSSLLSTVLMYFHSKGIRFKYIVIAAIILPLIPSIGLQPIALLPDLANAISILWLVYVLVRIFDEVILKQSAGRRQQISLCLQLCISLVFVFFMRSNSFPVYIVMAPVLFLLFIFRDHWKFAGSVAVSLLFVLLIRFPGYNALNVHFPSPDIPQIRIYHNAQFYAGMHDIKAAYLAGGIFHESTVAWLRHVVPNIDDPEFVFVPEFVQTPQFYLADLNTRIFLAIYMDSLRNNPIEMIRSVLFRIRPYWAFDPKTPINTVNFTAISGDDRPGDYFDISLSRAPRIGVERRHNFLTVMMNEYIWFMNKSIPATFFWRFGFWSAIMIISVMTLVLQKKYLWLLAYLPVFIYFLTLVLTAGWPDHRFGLPIFFTGLFLPGMLLFLSSGEEADAYD